jgi:hypothetical protein
METRVHWWLPYGVSVGGAGAFAFAVSKIARHVSNVWRFKIASKNALHGSAFEVDKDGGFTVKPPPLQQTGLTYESFYKATFSTILNECTYLWPVDTSQAEKWIRPVYFEILDNWDFYRTRDLLRLNEILSDGVFDAGSRHFPPGRIVSLLSKSSDPSLPATIDRFPGETQAEKVRDVIRYVISRLSKREREIFRGLFREATYEQIAKKAKTDVDTVRSCEKRMTELFDEACHEAQAINSAPVATPIEIPVVRAPPKARRYCKPKPEEKRRRERHEAPQR